MGVTVRLSEIASALGLDWEGRDLSLEALAGLDDAGEGDLTFVTGPRYARAFERSRAGAFLLPPDFESLGRPCLRTPAPYRDFARAIELILPAPQAPPAGVHPTAVIAEGAWLADDVAIGPLVVVGARCRIGARSVIHPHVTLYADCEIGSDCIIHSGAQLREGTCVGDGVRIQNGAVLGSDGFGHVHGADGMRFLVPHRCPVELGSHVEVGANSTLDASHPGQPRRGHATTRTRIGSGTRIDNLVQVGHGCSLGADNTLCAQVGLAGGTSTEASVLFGGKASSAGHVHLGEGTLIGAQTAITRDTPAGAERLGIPGMERRAWGRFVASRRYLPGLLRRVRAIEERLGLRSGDESRPSDTR